MRDGLINHSYTICEIERMRKAVYAIMFPVVWHSRSRGIIPNGGGRPGQSEEKAEIQLRTYMVAGIRPEALEEHGREKKAESERRRLEFPLENE